MPNSLRSALKGIDRAQLDALVDPIVRAHGAEVVDIEFKTDRGGWVLAIYVEKLGSGDNRLSTEDAAVNLELCSDVARELSPVLDVADLVPHAYNLEVSSPGIERSLRGTADFERFVGKKAKLRLHHGIENAATGVPQKVIVGMLGGLTAATSEADATGGSAKSTHLSMIDGSKTYSVPLSDIASARLVFEFGPAPKPGKSGKGSSKSKSPAERFKRSV